LNDIFTLTRVKTLKNNLGIVLLPFMKIRDIFSNWRAATNASNAFSKLAWTFTGDGHVWVMLLPKTPHPLACHIKYDRFPTSAAVDRALIRAFSVGFAGDDLQKKGSWTVWGAKGLVSQVPAMVFSKQAMVNHELEWDFFWDKLIFGGRSSTGDFSVPGGW
jgi:hypothetical protein